MADSNKRSVEEIEEAIAEIEKAKKKKYQPVEFLDTVFSDSFREGLIGEGGKFRAEAVGALGSDGQPKKVFHQALGMFAHQDVEAYLEDFGKAQRAEADKEGSKVRSALSKAGISKELTDVLVETTSSFTSSRVAKQQEPKAVEMTSTWFNAMISNGMSKEQCKPFLPHKVFWEHNSRGGRDDGEETEA